MPDPEFTFRFLGSGGLIEIICQKEPPAYLIASISIFLILIAVRLPVGLYQATILRSFKRLLKSFGERCRTLMRRGKDG
jgi:hypothetical protein